jgi:predicted ATPase
MHLLEAHGALGNILFFLGEYPEAWTHLEQGIALTKPTAERGLALHHDRTPGVGRLAAASLTLWCLGYPAQAVRRSQEALAVQAHAETLLTLATAQGFPLWVGLGTCWRGWTLAMQGQSEAGLTQLRQGLAAVAATGQALSQPFGRILLAEAVGHTGQVEEGLRLLTETRTAFEASGRGDLLAEAYQLQGEFLLRQAVPDAAHAETCFQQALAVAQRQQAKSWELRATMSLSRLWIRQGKRDEARELLARSTAGLPRALTPPTCRRPKYCWKS